MLTFTKGVEIMAECNHVFIGKSDGVHCTRCGLHMSAENYAKFLNPENPEEKPKRQARKKVKADE